MIRSFSRNLWLSLVVALSWGAVAQACDVPVFRYAMLHWAAEPYRVLVFHRGVLTPKQQAAVKALREAGPEENGTGNFTVETVDVNAGAGKDQRPSPPSAVLPCIVACFPNSSPEEPAAWSGPLTLDNVRVLTDLPARRELAKRLRQGQTAVSILLEGGDRQRDEAAARNLEEILQKLEKTLELPRNPPDPDLVHSLRAPWVC